ncbi:pyridoxamine 5'-phosphate oxidase family protein [Niveibacterium sp.]|uniref:pyridoxamine 5'-phosphate oxidase family protein n=1 Tax=Niveibacterium sp. TaxID=2017444 RepID=UPI0035AE56D7
MSSRPPTPAEIVPAWRHVLSADLAAHAQHPAASFVQLATLDVDGFPANRTLTFRRFGQTSELVFTTDLRSQKCEQIAHDAKAEACWYFADARVQWRLRGRVGVAGPRSRTYQTLRAEVWALLSESSRRRFLWPTPGQALGESIDASLSTPNSPPASFGLLVLSPLRAGRLDLRAAPNRHLSWSATRSGWRMTELNP